MAAAAWLIPLITATIQAGGAAAGGMLGRKKDTSTEMQQRQQELIDELLSSMGGTGKYGDLFKMDQNAFQKSYVDPMKQLFSSQIAPSIQQSYIASGQQRGTGLNDQLLRAGVDMDQLLNQEYMKYMQSTQDRKYKTIEDILGMQKGAERPQSRGEAFTQGLGGYLTSGGFGKTLEDIFKNIPRKGFEDTYSKNNSAVG